MESIVERAIREPDVQSPRQYARHVHRLAAAYAALFFGSLAGIVLIVWKGQLYVNLSQRSNVETLTLAFFLVFFAYLDVLSVRGALGAAHILYYAVLARTRIGRDEAERRKMRAIGPPTGRPAVVALNMALEREGRRGEPFAIPVRDGIGSLGAIVVDGARVSHEQSIEDGSNNLLAYFTQQVNIVLRTRGAPDGLDIVEWKKINDEATAQYLGVVRFARNLERHLGSEPLWPTCTVNTDDCSEVERRLSAICPALRNEAFLPHWEYEGQHQVPLIPEPLGLISLSRTEKRVDPLASMGCAVLVVLAVVIMLILIILFPPWVPGT